VNRRAALLLALLAVAACRNPEPPPPPKAAKPAQKSTTAGEGPSIAAPIADVDGDNLLNVAYGAAVVSRTAELNLASSAAHAIDSMSFTVWSSAPGGPEQELVFSLGARSHIERVGVTTTVAAQSPAKVRFESSTNGRSWRNVITMEPDATGTKIVDVKPFQARYLRVTTSEPSEFYATFASIHAIGSETAPPEQHSFDGCWSINTFASRLVQRGARVTGVIGGTKPTFIDGGIEGRVAKLLWIRGPQWGNAAATLTADGRGLTGIIFYEEASFNHNGEAWIGSPCDDASTASANALPAAPGPADYLRRIGTWTMSGLIFDKDERLVEEPSRFTLDDAASLIAATPTQRFRITAREFRNNDVNENRRRTVARIDAVRKALRARGVDLARIEFIGKGSDASPDAMPSALQRALWSRIDLQKIR
jgi:outer membrane protein OmpA-like peptidoglycan-associated protein